MAIKELRGKLVLITGAGSGIGRATALAFAKHGARVIATDLDLAPLAGLRAEIETLGTTCATYAVDVADEAAMSRLADDVHGSSGPLDVLINNAGVGFMEPFLESNLTHWPRVLGVNVMGVVHGCYFFIPRMIAAGGARQVVIVSSGAANYPPPSVAAYATSKFGVFGFAEVLKMELTETAVGVTTVCPGVINTAIVRSSPSSVSPMVGAAQQERLRAYYQKHGASPDLVAADIVKAVQRGTDVLMTGPAAQLFFVLRRISLRLARTLTYMTARQVGYR